MGRLVYRIFAALIALAGALLFAFMMEASYRTDGAWDQLLIRIGMPLSFLLPMVGALMVAVGFLMFSHAAHLARREAARSGSSIRP